MRNNPTALNFTLTELRESAACYCRECRKPRARSKSESWPLVPLDWRSRQRLWRSNCDKTRSSRESPLTLDQRQTGDVAPVEMQEVEDVVGQSAGLAPLQRVLQGREAGHAILPITAILPSR